MAKKDDIQGVQCENADFEIMRRQLARLEKMLTDKFTEVNDRIGSITVQAPAFPPSRSHSHSNPSRFRCLTISPAARTYAHCRA